MFFVNKKAISAFNILFLLTSFTVSFHTVQAQITVEGTPPSFKMNNAPTIPIINAPSFDLDKVLKADAKRQKESTKPMPARFGHKIDMNFDLTTDGAVENLPNGDKVYTIGMRSAGAYSLNYLFSDFYLPEGAELYLYNKGKDYVVGAITALNNKPYHKFSTAPIPSDVTYFEYYEPANVAGQGRIVLSHLVHAYRDLFSIMGNLAKGYGDSGPCNIDVACPLGSNYTDQINSVSLVLINGNDWCSGSMVNNTNDDGTPYYLTADHCLDGIGAQVNLWNFIWNYQSPSCGGPDGSQLQSVSGATLRASSTNTDFALLELSTAPPSNYFVYYAGWDNSGVVPSSSIAIHHPSGDVKKISENTDPLSNGIAQGPNYWRVGNWEQGTTEGGSSGSPLFDENKRIVGQLFGGVASCSNNSWDEYGKFSESWDALSSISQQLKHWLDPLNTGVSTLDGRYFSGPPSYDIALSSIDYPTALICDTTIAASISVQNKGDSVLNFFDIAYRYDNNAWDTLTWNGTLTTLQKTTLTLPTKNISFGTHTIEVSLLMPNDSVDTNLSNNTITNSFSVGQGFQLGVNFKADGGAAQTSFEVLDENGTILYSQYGFTPNQTYQENFCLSSTPSCYRIAVTDGDANGFVPSSFLTATINGIPIDTIQGIFENDTIYFCTPFDLKANAKLGTSYCSGETITPDNTSQLAANYSWTMPGAIPSSSSAKEPSFYYPNSGSYNVFLSVTDVLGVVNDTMLTVNIDNGRILTVDLLTDDYPEETSYEILDSNGVVVVSAGNFSLSSTLYQEIACLAPGCYTFQIYDTADDGICCGFGNGNYTLTGPDSVVIATGGQFGNLDVVNFCIIATGIHIIPTPNDVKVFPNPTSGLLEFESPLTPNSIEVFDLMGRRLQVITPTAAQRINLENTANGVYLLRFIFDGGTVSKKVVKW